MAVDVSRSGGKRSERLAESLGAARIALQLSGVVLGGRPVEFVLAGESATAAQTSLNLSIGGMAMTGASMGVPVPVRVTAMRIAAAWVSGSVPAGAWTATLQRRAPGESGFTNVATAAIETS